MTENVKRGLGDNSKINSAKESYNTWGEILEEVTKNILTLTNKLTAIQDMHKASHGHEYTFKDEIDETKSNAFLNKYVYGVTRKCTPFEKKDFAGRANAELEQACTDALSNYGKLVNIRSELKAKSKEVADE